MKNKLTKIFNKLLTSFVCVLLLNTPSHAIETTTYYHHDGLGSPIAASDVEGNLLWREDYQPYGSRVRNPSNADNNLWYTGKPEEPELGLQYFGARWYDPVAGRFTGIDPVEVKEDNIHSFNRYAYANNNPYAYVDPDGEDAISISTTVHIPGLGLLKTIGLIDDIPISGAHGGVAISFPGFWSPDAEFDIGFFGGGDIGLDLGFGKISGDIGFHKGSVKDLSGSSDQVSGTAAKFNVAFGFEKGTNDLTDVQIGRGETFGRFAKYLNKRINKLVKEGKLGRTEKTILDSNFSIVGQTSGVLSFEHGLVTDPDDIKN